MSTFSIIAIDKESKEVGIAVATNNIAVGASTIYIDPMIGAFSVIAETEPQYGINGLSELRRGQSVRAAIEHSIANDDSPHSRQVAGIDMAGNSHVYTGSSVKYWKGHAGQVEGPDYVIVGNQLADSVLQRMAYTFENTDGSLSFKLLESLIAGQVNGGQITGKRSAALVVKGQDNEWYNQVDMRVDNSDSPVADLQTIYNYQEGRIALNQARYALTNDNVPRAKEKLGYAASMLSGWDGMYGKIAMLHSLLGDEDSAVKWINRGLLENPSWAQNLPSFYYLKDNPELKHTIDERTFSSVDWENAVQMLGNLGRLAEGKLLIERLIDRGTESSMLYYFLARVQIHSGQEVLARTSLEKSLALDASNLEAKDLLTELN